MGLIRPFLLLVGVHFVPVSQALIAVGIMLSGLLFYNKAPIDDHSSGGLLVTSVYLDTCENVTDPGIIGDPQILCGIPAIPTELMNIEEASGGSGPIHYIWLASTTGCPNGLNGSIPGATYINYDPGPLLQSTWFLR